MIDSTPPPVLIIMKEYVTQCNSESLILNFVFYILYFVFDQWRSTAPRNKLC